MSESSVRLITALLIASPACIVMKAADEFKDKTPASNQQLGLEQGEGSRRTRIWQSHKSSFQAMF